MAKNNLNKILFPTHQSINHGEKYLSGIFFDGIIYCDLKNRNIN